MPDIPDFLTLPDAAPDLPVDRLRRQDLALLRLHARSPHGLPVRGAVSRDVRERLLRAGMLDRRDDADGVPRTFVTAFGAAVVRANVSCRDGSEMFFMSGEQLRAAAAVDWLRGAYPDPDDGEMSAEPGAATMPALTFTLASPALSPVPAREPPGTLATVRAALRTWFIGPGH